MGKASTRNFTSDVHRMSSRDSLTSAESASWLFVSYPI